MCLKNYSNSLLLLFVLIIMKINLFNCDMDLEEEEMEIIRDYNGDIFTLSSPDCNNNNITCDHNGRYAKRITNLNHCKCQCAPTHSIFREDTKQCVHDLQDCPLVGFIRPYISEKIPVISLPVSTGQLIHPGAHLTLSDVDHVFSLQSISCQIENAKLLTNSGWKLISDDNYRLFDLFQDNNKTFLQWFGGETIRSELQQKLILIKLNCHNNVSSIIYSPCISIRIGWVPGALITDSNYYFTDMKNINYKQNYLIIGLCLGFLGLMYVCALMIYIKTKKIQMRKRSMDKTTSSLFPSTESSPSSSSPSSPLSSTSSASSSRIDTLDRIEKFEDGIREGHSNQSNNNNNNYDIKKKNQSKDLRIEVKNDENNRYNNNHSNNRNSNNDDTKTSLQLLTSERISRRTLHINPEYFSPELMQSPPQSALEFLERIREMITIAKSRIRNFRFRPSLLVIPEDDYFYQDIGKNDSSRNSVVKTDQSARNNHSPHVKQHNNHDFNHNSNISFETQVHCEQSENISKFDEFRKDLVKKLENQAEQIIKQSIDEDSTNNLDMSNFKLSRKEMIIKIQENDLSTSTNDKLNNNSLNHFYGIENHMPPLDSLKLLSLKVANKLSDQTRGFNLNGIISEEKQDKVQDSIKDYKKNSLIKAKKSQINDNWTLLQKNSANELESMTTSDNCTSCDEDVIDKKSYNAITSLLSHEDNNNSLLSSLTVSMNGYECDNEQTTSFDTWSSTSDVSTTSSSFKQCNGYPSIELASLEDSEDSFSKDVSITFSDDNEDIEIDDDDDNPIEVCLRQLANTPIDNKDINSKVDRATKGLSTLYKIKSRNWHHVCHHHHHNHHNHHVKNSKNHTGYYSDDNLSNFHNRDKKLTTFNHAKVRRSRMMGYTQSPFINNLNNNNNTQNDSNKVYSKQNTKTAQSSQKTYHHNHMISSDDEHICHHNGSLSEDELLTRIKSPKTCCNHGQSLSTKDTIWERHSKPTIGTCKQYIQQKNHSNHFITNKNGKRLPSKKFIKDLSSHKINDKKLKIGTTLITEDHINTVKPPTVIKVNNSSNGIHFVTTIPV